MNGRQDHDQTALELAHISKRFGATVALDDVSLSMENGSAHAMIGENGAGKSTLVKIIGGAIRPDRGRVSIFGDEVTLLTPERSARLGIATVFQELSLFPEMTVAENLFLGQEPTRLGYFVSKRDLRERAAHHLAGLGLERVLPEWRVGELTLPEKQQVEIAKALAREPRLLLFDESTSALAAEAMSWFRSIIAGLREKGTTLVYITHRLAEIRDLCDSVTILRNGRVVGTWPVGELAQPEMVRLMIGRTLDSAFPPKLRGVEAAPVLETRDLTSKGAFSGINVRLVPGEILGLVGLEGQGQLEFVRTLFGAHVSHSGSIYVRGEKAHLRSPRHAIKLDMGFVPQERKTEGLFLRMSVLANMAIAWLDRFAILGWVRDAPLRSEVDRTAKGVGLHPRSLKMPATSLSGGNQQKIAIGRWILGNSRLLLLYDPTRGVDVGTKFEIYKLMHDLARQGTAILFYSSELPEVLAIAQRVVVFYGGQVVAEFSGDAIEEDSVMAAAIGHGEGK